MNIYYKFKLIGDNWFILFEKDGEKEFIYNDREALINYLDDNRGSIFIGGDNYYEDNFMIASIIKNGIPNGDVEYNDVLYLVPMSLDVTQEIVRSNPVKLDTCLLNLNRRSFNYSISAELNNKDLEKVLEELDYKVAFIKELFRDREDYFRWRLGFVEEFNLPRSFVQFSKGKLMEYIVGFDGSKKNGIVIDENLRELISNDEDMMGLLNGLCTSELDGQVLKFGDLEVGVGKQGLKGGRDNYVDTTGENNYLYIDFNSFGPSIIINNNLLSGISKYPERYKMIRDRRIELKAIEDSSQKYYKRLINSFIDSFNIEESLGYNPDIYNSITINGVLVMYYLYTLIKDLGVEVIEVNTDGMIVKCPKDANEKIREIVNSLCGKLNMSCDVDRITKIAHKNVQSYCVEFEDGTIKKIGEFGKMEDEVLQTNSKRYLSECLLHYYLGNDHDIMEKLLELRARNNPEIFQEIVQRAKNANPIYIFRNGEYIELKGQANKFVVVRDSARTPVYKKNDKGEIVQYHARYNFELIENGFEGFDMNRLDLNYYFIQVLSKVEATSGKKFVILDIDGTLVEDQDNRVLVSSALEKMRVKLSDEDINKLDTLVSYAFRNFMSECKKGRCIGTTEKFASCCKEKCSVILGEEFDYEKFSKTYFKVSEDLAKKDTKLIDGVEDGIIDLIFQGYRLVIWSNGLSKVQNAKLERALPGLDIKYMGCLDTTVGKASSTAVEEFIKDVSDKTKTDFRVQCDGMIGNGTSDLLPKKSGIKVYILRNGREKMPKTIMSREASGDGSLSVQPNLGVVAKVLRRKPVNNIR